MWQLREPRCTERRKYNISTFNEKNVKGKTNQMWFPELKKWSGYIMKSLKNI